MNDTGTAAGTERQWHATPAKEALKALESTLEGLAPQEARVRMERYGPNQLKAAPPASRLKMLLEQFTSPLILILIGAAILLFIIAADGGEPEQNIDAVLILTIVAFNAALGFIQNYRAQRGIESLQRLAQPEATFLRDGHTIREKAVSLVPGDIALLEEGDRVPADGRILEAYDVQVDESSLTGESLPVHKGRSL
jgi:Ca2+-transporting ATPase